MRFWKYVKNLINVYSEDSKEQGNESDDQSNQNDSSNSEDSKEQSSESDNQPNQNESSNGEDSKEQSSESDNQSNQNDSLNGDDSKEQGSESDNQPNQSDSSNSEDSKEQGSESDNQQNPSDSSNSEDSKEQGNESDNQSSKNDSSNGDDSKEQGSESDNQPNQSDSSNSEDSKEQGSESDNQLNQSDSSNSEDSKEQSSESNNQQNPSDSSNSEDSKEQGNESDNQSSKNDSLNGDDSKEQGSESDNQPNQSDSSNSEDSKEQSSESDNQSEQSMNKQEDKSKVVEKSKLNGDKKESLESTEEKYELSEQTNNFINQLNELPSFENRSRGAGYSIDTNGYTEVPDSVIRTLITKFLNQRFCKRTSDLNVRSNSLEKTKGFYKWEVKDVIVHLETHQITKVLTDKYGYEYAQGKNENVPLSFYFDMSGSMSKYTNMLAVIAIELLKKNVKVLVGFNERVNVQFESIKGNIDVLELSKILQSAGYTDRWYSSYSRKDFIKDPRVTYKYIDRNLDNYLIDKKAEKCVVFADFDPKDEVENLSQKAQVYWFCFEDNYRRVDLDDYRGFIYPVQNVNDILEGLIKVNDNRFETLCYTDNPKILQRKLN